MRAGRRLGRRDQNEAAIVDALRKCGVNRNPDGWSEKRVCLWCSAVFIVSGRLRRKRCCSRLCGVRYAGLQKRKPKRTCQVCHRACTKTFCSRQCSGVSRRGAKWRREAARLLPFRAPSGGSVTLTCEGCQQPYQRKASHAKQSRYCSIECRGRHYKERFQGAANPNFRNALERKKCAVCEAPTRSYNKDSKYCSRSCYLEAARSEPMRRKARKDNNHHEIVDAFKKLGCLVLDMSHAGGGWPDLVVNDRMVLRLVEIKNPETYYGRKGLNALQQKFNASAQVSVVTSLDDVIALVGRWRKDRAS